jgi:hypothetical protein
MITFIVITFAVVGVAATLNTAYYVLKQRAQYRKYTRSLGQLP